MSIFKDFRKDTEGYRFRRQLKESINPQTWLRLHNWRKQRADRGWSDRDTWGAGDHIALITAEILQHLNDHSYVDWPEWFKLNVKENGKGAYANLQDVINDITEYLNFTETSWADGLDTRNDELDKIFKKREDHMYEYVGPEWYEGEKKLSAAAITHRVNKWAKEDRRLYKKAQRAMGFFARHFSGFWD